MRRLVPQLPAIARRSVAGADAHGHGGPIEVQAGANGVERFGEVPFDVVAKTAEGRDIHAPQAVAARARGMFGVELGEDSEERGERFARAGGRDEQQVLAIRDSRPGHALGWGRAAGKRCGKPIADDARREAGRLRRGREDS